MAKLKAIKEAKKNGNLRKPRKAGKEVYPIDPHLQEQFRKDDEDIEYYAKNWVSKMGKRPNFLKLTIMIL